MDINTFVFILTRMRSVAQTVSAVGLLLSSLRQWEKWNPLPPLVRYFGTGNVIFAFKTYKGDPEHCWRLREGNLRCDKRHSRTQLHVMWNVSSAKLEGNQNSTRQTRIQWDEGIKAWKTWVNITKLSSDGTDYTASLLTQVEQKTGQERIRS